MGPSNSEEIICHPSNKKFMCTEVQVYESKTQQKLLVQLFCILKTNALEASSQCRSRSTHLVMVCVIQYKLHVKSMPNQTVLIDLSVKIDGSGHKAQVFCTAIYCIVVMKCFVITWFHRTSYCIEKKKNPFGNPIWHKNGQIWR